MSDIKPKLSSLVAGQLPEFIREDYQTFVAFLEAYYEFLETNVNTDYRNLKDLDATLDSFIKYFKHEIAFNLPNLPIDERFFLQHIKELYQSKGTDAAYKLLFRILFKKSVEVDYPYSRVLIPSDGRWVQDKSIFVRVTKGDPDIIVGQKVKVLTKNASFDITIKSYKEIDSSVVSAATTKNQNVPVFNGAGITFSSSLYDAGTFTIGTVYKITYLGDTDWNYVAGTTDLTYVVGSTFTATTVGAGSGIASIPHAFISSDDVIFRDNIKGIGAGSYITITGTTDSLNDTVCKIFSITDNGTTGYLYVSFTNASSITNFTNQTSVSDTLLVDTREVPPDPNKNELLELFYEKKYYNNISPGDRIYYNNNAFIATILPTTTKVKVFAPGTSFKVGQVYPVNSGKGNGSIIKIKSIDSNGGIKTAEFISFGIGYESDFYAYISSNQSQKILYNQLPFTIAEKIVGTGYDATLRDNTELFIDYGIITKPNYNIDTATPAFGALYVGDVVAKFNNLSPYKDVTVDNSDIGIIYISIDAEATYTGFFKSNEGFISDNIYIQDSKYYNKFSYVLKIDEKLSNYESFVKKLVHPTGNALFGEYAIFHELNLAETLESLIKFSNLVLDDVITPSDSTLLSFFANLGYERLLDPLVTNRGNFGVNFSIPLIGKSVGTIINSIIPGFIMPPINSETYLTTNNGNIEKSIRVVPISNNSVTSIGNIEKSFDIDTIGTNLTLSTNNISPSIAMNIALTGKISTSGFGVLSKNISNNLLGNNIIVSKNSVGVTNVMTVGLTGIPLSTSFGNNTTSQLEVKSINGLGLTTNINNLLTPSIVSSLQLSSNIATSATGSIISNINVSIQGFGLTSYFGVGSNNINIPSTDIISVQDSGYTIFNAYIFEPSIYIDNTYFAGLSGFDYNIITIPNAVISASVGTVTPIIT